MPVLAAGSVAPAFELGGTDGRPYSLAGALDRAPVLATFFKVGCPTCQFTLPFLERLFQQFRTNGAQVWGISQDNAADSRHFAASFGITFPILIDEKPYKTSRVYSLEYVPSVFLIGGDGRILISSDGFSKSDLLAIDASLARQFPDTNSRAVLFRPGERIPEYKPG